MLGSSCLQCMGNTAAYMLDKRALAEAPLRCMAARGTLFNTHSKNLDKKCRLAIFSYGFLTAANVETALIAKATENHLGPSALRTSE